MKGEPNQQEQGLENNWMSRNMDRKQPTECPAAFLDVLLFSDV